MEKHLKTNPYDTLNMCRKCPDYAECDENYTFMSTCPEYEREKGLETAYAEGFEKGFEEGKKANIVLDKETCKKLVMLFFDWRYKDFHGELGDNSEFSEYIRENWK